MHHFPLFAAMLWRAAVLDAAREHHVDPYVLGALVEHESHGRAAAVGPPPWRCLGLVQVCPSTLPECRSAPGGPACAAAKDRLLDGAYNLRAGAAHLAQWAAHCRKRTGRAETRHVLSGYGGFDGRGISCGQRRDARGRWRDAPVPRAVRDVLRIAARLRGAR